MRYTAKKSKYHSRKTACLFGHTHDSRTEAERCNLLHGLQRMGIIKDLRTQVKYVLIPSQRAKPTEVYKKGKLKGQAKPGKVIEHECAYYADFVYTTKDGKNIVEDVKGQKTEAYKIKKKLMLYVHGIRIQEVKV